MVHRRANYKLTSRTLEPFRLQVFQGAILIQLQQDPVEVLAQRVVSL
jgi:hypothetical protein